jgi:hypothetical protein
MLEHRQHPQRLRPNLEQFRQPQNKIIGIEPATGNEGVEMFGQAGDAGN